MNFTPSLLAPLAERFQYGGLNAISKDELIDALAELDRVKDELDDAQCDAAASADDAEEATAQLESARSVNAIFAERFGKIVEHLASINATLDYLSHHFTDEFAETGAKQLDDIREKSDEIEKLCDTETFE
jgi:hypothetical protein